jgi:RNA polymerase sigma-70 factor (ECF subfamily)
MLTEMPAGGTWVVSDQLEEVALTNRAAREAFVEASYSGLFRWLLRLTRSPDLAADLTQETFVEFWKSLGRRPRGVDERAWLYAVGRNRWRKAVRDCKHLARLHEGSLLDSGRTAEARVEEGEFRAAVEAAIADMPPDLREAFTLRFWHEFEYEDIAVIQGVTAGLVRWRYFAARRSLHDRLAEWDPRPRMKGEERHAR